MPVLLGPLVLRLVLRTPAKDAYMRPCTHEYEAFDLYERIRDAGVPARVAPAPHGMQACCGTSVMLDPADGIVRVLLLTRSVSH